MAYLIKVNGERMDVQPATGKKFTLAEVQAHVGGYYTPIKLGHGDSMLVDEDGTMKRLPFNRLASLMVGMYIVGPVLIINRSEF